MTAMSLFANTAADDDGMAAAREALQGNKADKKQAEEVPLRDTVITAKHMEYNRKENVAILTEDVVIDDARFRLTAERVYVFLENQAAEEGEKGAEATVKVGDSAEKQTFSQIVCLGKVEVKSETREAACDKAVYTRAEACLVLVGNARMSDIKDGKANTITGDKITIWTEEERIEVYPNPTLRLNPGSSKNMKDVL
jgi:lipopolysaccharide transport protein LptA